MPTFARSLAHLGAASLRQAVASPTVLRTVPDIAGVSSDQRTYLAQLNGRLAGTEGARRQRLVKQIHEHLRTHATGETPPSEAEVALGLRRMERALRTSPLHIGFACDQGFFDRPGAFFQTGIYANGVARYNPSDGAGGKRPVYAAANFGLGGHEGWGGSCFVLKPHLLDGALLSSCDTGDPYSRYSAQECTPQHPLPIIEDWIQDADLFRPYWKALAGEERTPVPRPFIDRERPVEARLFTPDGRLHPKDMAMVCVHQSELDDPAKRLEALDRFQATTGIPVVVRRGPQGTPFPDDVPGYQNLVKAYEAHADGLERAAAAAVASAPPHYTKFLDMHRRIKPDWTPQPHL